MTTLFLLLHLHPSSNLLHFFLFCSICVLVVLASLRFSLCVSFTSVCGEELSPSYQTVFDLTSTAFILPRNPKKKNNTHFKTNGLTRENIKRTKRKLKQLSTVLFRRTLKTVNERLWQLFLIKDKNSVTRWLILERKNKRGRREGSARRSGHLQ